MKKGNQETKEGRKKDKGKKERRKLGRKEGS